MLVADDHAPLRELIATLLTDDGYEVLTAESGEEALRIAGGRTIDLLITDIGMPGLSGHELAQRLKEQSSGLCVVVISGAPPRTQAAPGSQFLQKPFSGKALLAIVADILRDKRPATGL